MARLNPYLSDDDIDDPLDRLRPVGIFTGDEDAGDSFTRLSSTVLADLTTIRDPAAPQPLSAPPATNSPLPNRPQHGKIEPAEAMHVTSGQDLAARDRDRLVDSLIRNSLRDEMQGLPTMRRPLRT